MNNAFFETSMEIANDFLQNIVFIDDKAFLDERNSHEFNALQITQAFAKRKKICAVYKPETVIDINNLALLAKKADITVIDWQLNIKAEEIPGSSEEDAKEDDPRGPYTRQIIREILSDPLTGEGSLKLILIYTGEIGLYDITDSVYEDLKTQNIKGIQKGDCIVSTENIKILVIAKPSSIGQEGEQKFKHNPELNKKIIKYEDLPDFILFEFTKMTSGLLSNFVIKSLTILRYNTFRLLKIYNKDIDPSFLSHRLLLPNQDDAKEQLIDILSNSLQALLNYNHTGEIVSIANILNWIDTRELDHKIKIDEKEINIDADFVKTWAENNFIEACKKRWIESGFSDLDHLPENKFRNYERDLYKDGSLLLRNKGDRDEIDCEFSILTHHKSNLKQTSSPPKLSLGTLIKEEPGNRYFLCIQARCDCERITDTRKFLFLPLETVGEKEKFHFVVQDNIEYIRLRIMKETFKLRTIIFNPDLTNQIILAQIIDSQYYFISNFGEQFKWLADLKDAHAQRVANNFASQLSRVGLAESEWLRRWAGN